MKAVYRWVCVNCGFELKTASTNVQKICPICGRRLRYDGSDTR